MFLVHAGTPGLFAGNHEFHRRLIQGLQIFWQQDGETRGARARLVDFDEPDKNDWLVVNQFTVLGQKKRRPDVVVFLNGLPIAVIELKNPTTEQADVWAAFRQLQTYKDEIPDLFRTNELLIATDGMYARLGSLTADQERFQAWRSIDGKMTDPLGKFGELETLIRGLFDKARLLDYLRHFIVYDAENKAKLIAAWHQFHAVRAVVDQVLAASAKDGDGKGGVVWHTQGAGKSLEMTCLAGKLMTHPWMQNPTLVMVTDRNDLAGQLFSTFSTASEVLGETPAQAETRGELRTHLDNRPSGGIIFTTIQKFVPGEDEDTFPVLTDRHNIVVICDEAHRSQYALKARFDKDGNLQYGLAKSLRDALPNATYVAFTGTPISQADRDTRAVFGNYVAIYDIEQAVKDGATVPIYYESRLAKLELNADQTPHIDDAVEELIEIAKEFQRAAERGEQLGLSKDELAFYDTLTTNEASIRELGDEMLRKIAQELADRLRKSNSVDWYMRDSVRARLRLMVRTILKKYKYPPDQQEEATETVLKQAEVLSAAWAAAV